MHEDTKNYVKRMRKQGKSDDDIKKSLAANDWRPEEIAALFGGAADTHPVPLPPHKTQEPKPIAVVQQYSTIGMEYSIMFISLFFGAISFGAILHAAIDYYNSYTIQGPFLSTVSLPAVTAMVTLPLFAILFLRLRRIERTKPSVRNDASRRHGVQLTLIVSFIWGVATLIFYLYQLVNSIDDVNQARDYQFVQFIHLLITLVISGSIFAYYWIDEHRQLS